MAFLQKHEEKLKQYEISTIIMNVSNTVSCCFELVFSSQMNKLSIW